MSVGSALGIASSGLSAISQQLAAVSQNVANASTAGYAHESVSMDAVTAGGQGCGVRAGVVTRDGDAGLQTALNVQTADVAGLQVRSDALAGIDAAQGATASGDDLASRLGALSDSFTTLSADPSNQADQRQAVNAAGTLAGGIRSQAAAYATARQNAQDGLASDVGTLNAAVQSIGALSDQIIAAQAAGSSTADLEQQRNSQEQTASQLGGLTFLPCANGDVTAVAGGLVVDTRATTGPFSMAAATLGAGAPAPPLLLSGTDVTAQFADAGAASGAGGSPSGSPGGSPGGSIGARLSLRDDEIPQAQAGLDEFAATLSSRLSSQGLSLFTDPAGNPPVLGSTPVQAGYSGYSLVIQVNPAVTANPALVRDGTQSVAAGTGGASAFTFNPSGGPASFGTLINRVLLYGFGSEAQAGTPQPAPSTTGLGTAGKFSLPYAPGTTLASFAANLTASQAEAAGAASDALTSGQALQSTLATKLQSATGVSVDSELSNMIVLQNAYGANAKIIAAAQSMWTALIDAVAA